MNQEVSVVNDTPTTEEIQALGVGVRILYDGIGWGFADTDETDHESIRQVTLKAVSLAKGASKVGSKVPFAKETAHVDSWESPVKKNPFQVSLDEKYELLRDATGRMKGEGVVVRRGGMSFTTVDKYFASSEGSRIHQKITYSGGNIIVAAKGTRGLQRRSVQQYMSTGYVLIDQLALP